MISLLNSAVKWFECIRFVYRHLSVDGARAGLYRLAANTQSKQLKNMD